MTILCLLTLVGLPAVGAYLLFLKLSHAVTALTESESCPAELRPHRGISQEKLPLYLGFFEFVHNARRRGKTLLGALVTALVM
jgi:transposase-like protein